MESVTILSYQRRAGHEKSENGLARKMSWPKQSVIFNVDYDSPQGFFLALHKLLRLIGPKFSVLHRL